MAYTPQTINPGDDFAVEWANKVEQMFSRLGRVWGVVDTEDNLPSADVSMPDGTNLTLSDGDLVFVKASKRWYQWTGSIWVPMSVSWEDVENKPTEFPPAPHQHSDADITSLDWNKLINVPSTFPTTWDLVQNKPFADEVTVYIDPAEGSDTATGTETDPFKTPAGALNALAERYRFINTLTFVFLSGGTVGEQYIYSKKLFIKNLVITSVDASSPVTITGSLIFGSYFDDTTKTSIGSLKLKYINFITYEPASSFASFCLALAIKDTFTTLWYVFIQGASTSRYYHAGIVNDNSVIVAGNTSISNITASGYAAAYWLVNGGVLHAEGGHLYSTNKYHFFVDAGASVGYYNVTIDAPTVAVSYVRGTKIA